MVTYFSELVLVKEVRLKGDIVEFILDEAQGGFLFTHHHLTKLDVPRNRISNGSLPASLGRTKRYVPEKPLEIVLEARGPNFPK